MYKRQIHDGMNFIVSHSLLTNIFEFSLQRVNPKLTVPYWDFTIETTAASKVAYDPNQPLTRTELLSPSWFGTVDFEDYTVRGLISAILREVLLCLLLLLLSLLSLLLLMLLLLLLLTT